MGFILAAHIVALGGIIWTESRAALSQDVLPETVFSTAEIIQTRDARDKVPEPDLQLVNPTLQLAALQEIQFDDSYQDELAAVGAHDVCPQHIRRGRRGAR